MSLILSVFLFSSTLAEAQMLILIDGENGNHIPDAVVELTDNDGQSEFYVSNQIGQIKAKKVGEYTIEIKHLNFLTYRDTLFIKKRPEVLKLEPREYLLDELVVTGQFEPKMTSTSLLRVNVISNEKLKSLAAKNLTDVLMLSQNIRLRRDGSLGSSQVQMLGLGNEHVKFLIDGVPVSGKTGLGFEIDQLNLSNVERIEVIEGPMSVQFGSNALAGVINIITKKYLKDHYYLNLEIQEESIGSNYNLYDGFHNILLSGGTNIMDRLQFSASAGRRYFSGAQISQTGRQMDWDPKEQYMANAKLQAHLRRMKVSYRLDAMFEEIENKGSIENLTHPRAFDQFYNSSRIIHGLELSNFSKRIGKIQNQITWTDYKRLKNTYAVDLTTLNSELSSQEGQDTSKFKSLNVRSNITKVFSPSFSMNGGMDLLYDQTSGGRIEGDDNKTALDVGFYLACQWEYDRLELRPGLRASYNTRYNTPLVPSIHGSYDLTEHDKIRISYARGFRAPALRELYFEFIDNNHNVIGNDDLSAETSHFYEISVTDTRNYNEYASSTSEVRFFYTDLSNRIAYAQMPNDPLTTTLINQDEYTSYGLNANIQQKYKNLLVQIGGGILGYADGITASAGEKRFLTTNELSAAVQYRFPKSDVSLNASFKYYGKLPIYVIDATGSSTDKLIQDDYSIGDVSAFWRINKYFDLSGGVRNVFDIKSIANVRSGVHTGGSNVLIGYGRSFFIKTNIKFSKSK